MILTDILLAITLLLQFQQSYKNLHHMAQGLSEPVAMSSYLLRR